MEYEINFLIILTDGLTKIIKHHKLIPVVNQGFMLLGCTAPIILASTALYWLEEEQEVTWTTSINIRWMVVASLYTHNMHSLVFRYILYGSFLKTLLETIKIQV